MWQKSFRHFSNWNRTNTSHTQLSCLNVYAVSLAFFDTPRNCHWKLAQVDTALIGNWFAEQPRIAEKEAERTFSARVIPHLFFK
jgi:hypothetical protein